MRLIVQAGALSGDIFEVTKDDVTLGRGSNNDIVISDPAISRTHCQIRREGNGYVIQDANSANGTYINDERIALPYILRDGDEIRVGETRLRVEDANSVPVMGEDVTPATTAGAAGNRGGLLAGLAALAVIALLIAAVVMNQRAPTPIASAFTATRPATALPSTTPAVVPVSTSTASSTTAPTAASLGSATPIPTSTVETPAATSTTSPTPVPGRVYPIPVPTLLIPVSGAKFTGADPIQFGWSGGNLGPNEVYRIQVSTNNEFSKIACEIRTRDTTATIPGDAAVCTDLWQFGKQYYWRAHIVQRDVVSPDPTGTPYSGPAGEFSWAP